MRSYGTCTEKISSSAAQCSLASVTQPLELTDDKAGRAFEGCEGTIVCGRKGGESIAS
jgi:hypothetical protein